MKHKTAELEGALLDAAVAKAEGLPTQRPTGPVVVPSKPGTRRIVRAEEWPDYAASQRRFSTDWAKGGPIIEREQISIVFWGQEADPAEAVSACVRARMHGWEVCDPVARGDGPSVLIAAMRAYVASKFGEEVELP